ncbi:MAG: YIP1 family protein [Gammaproteobacteria bacterium]|nr:YIP1 family protein [Gammaproteobacteria bacterium]
MDFNKIIERAKNILLTPKVEWPVIAAEPATTASLYKNYLLWLAAIPAVLGFIDATVFGYSVPFMGSFRIGIGAALQGAVLSYVMTLVGVFVFSLIVNALAPTFGGSKDSVQALKVVAYSSTASLVIGGVATIVPWLGGLLALGAAIYGIYLLYLGLPPTMKCPPEKAAGYTAVAMIVALVIGAIFWGLAGRLLIGGIMSGGLPGLPDRRVSDDIEVDPDSPLGKLEAMGKQMEEAGRQLEQAQKSGDSKAQSEALGAVLGAALGGGGAKVESLAPDRLKAFLPETLAGLPRRTLSAERNAAMGMQISEGRATYGDGQGRDLTLEITDLGSAQGVMALAGWAAIESEKQTETGYEKTVRERGRIVHEEWDGARKSGEYSLVLGERFVAKVHGDASDIGQLRQALGSIDLAGLEALKGEGVLAAP